MPQEIELFVYQMNPNMERADPPLPICHFLFGRMTYVANFDNDRESGILASSIHKGRVKCQMLAIKFSGPN